MSIFLLKLLLSFFVGGLYIAFTVWLSEKYGSTLGGLVIGLPSTVLVSLIFIWWTQGTTIMISAIPIIPVAISVNSIFALIFVLTYKDNLKKAFLNGVIVWFLLTLPFILIGIRNIFISVLFSGIFFTVAVFLLRKFPHRKIEPFKLSRREMLFRIIFAGTVISLAVLLGKLLGPIWGGLLASFPAAFSSSLLLLTRTHGIDFASSVAKTMPYGSIGNVLFVVLFYFLVPVLGVIIGLLLAYLVSLTYALFLYKTIFNK